MFTSGKSIKGDEDLQGILQDRDAYAIPLEQIANVSGNRGVLRPSLKVAWHPHPGDPSATKVEFVQKSRPRTLDDVRSAISEWVPTIDQAAKNEIVLPELQTESPAAPAQPQMNESELRSRVLEDTKGWAMERVLSNFERSG